MSNLFRCPTCREPWIITDQGVTCGCPGPILGNVETEHGNT